MSRFCLTEYFVSYLLLMHTVDSRLTCLIGTDIPFPRDARRVIECGSSEYCSLEQYITPSGYLRHKAACKDTHNCGGVTVQSTDMVICSECCDTDLCSTTLCNQKGFDLQYGSLCYHCDYPVDQPDHCDTIRVCQDNEYGPLCYHCDYPVDQPDHCDTIRVCQDNEVCSVVKTITGEYRVGCSAKNVCEAAVKAGVCSSCCTDMLCNRNCSSLSSAHPARTTTSSSNTALSSKYTSTFLTPTPPSSKVDLSSTLPYITPTKSLPNCGCYYKHHIYRPGETWRDGCQYLCKCMEGCTAMYSCQNLCLNWKLPPVCHLNPPEPGNCCSVPSCPPDAGVVLHYPPGYKDPGQLHNSTL